MISSSYSKPDNWAQHFHHLIIINLKISMTSTLVPYSFKHIKLQNTEAMPTNLYIHICPHRFHTHSITSNYKTLDPCLQTSKLLYHQTLISHLLDHIKSENSESMPKNLYIHTHQQWFFHIHSTVSNNETLNPYLQTSKLLSH